MASDIQLAQDFPYTRPDAGQDQFTGNTLEDALRQIPPAMRKAWADAAKAVNETPCKVWSEAEKIYNGLQKGTITYKGINKDSKFIEFNGTDIKMHGGHSSLMMGIYGRHPVESLLREKFPPEGFNQAANDMSYSLGIEIGSMFLNRRHPIRDHLPAVPDISKCAMM